MATYLTLNSKFTPYTYEEILKPYQDRQKALEDKLTALEETSAKASLWEGILDPVADKEYYESFNEFKSRLEDLSSRLSAGDASAVTKKELSRLKQEYNKQFVPLELKYAELKQAQEEQRKALLQASQAGREIGFTKDLSNTSLTTVMTDPNWNIYSPIIYDNIAEASMLAGVGYGEQELGYKVYGAQGGYEQPEDINTVIEDLYSKYIPSDTTDQVILDKIANIVTTNFNTGRLSAIGADKYNKLLNEISKRNVSETNATTQGRNDKLYAAINGLRWNPQTGEYEIDPNTLKGRAALYGNNEDMTLKETYAEETGNKIPILQNYGTVEEYDAARIQWEAGYNAWAKERKAKIEAQQAWNNRLSAAGMTQEQFDAQRQQTLITIITDSAKDLDTNDYIKIKDLQVTDREKDDSAIGGTHWLRGIDKPKNLTKVSQEELEFIQFELSAYLMKKGLTLDDVEAIYKSKVGDDNYVIKYKIQPLT